MHTTTTALAPFFQIGNAQSWQRLHNEALKSPRSGNEARTVALLCSVHSASLDYSGECYLAIREVAEPLIRAARFALNYDLGRLDAGTLDRALCHLADSLGIDLDA